MPKMIFIPDKNIIRTMMRGIIEKREDESDDSFLLKFGLIENLKSYLEKA